MTRIISLLVLVFSFATSLRAQSATPSLPADAPLLGTSSATPTASISKKGRMTATEILEFHILLAENDFAHKKDLATRSDLVSVYERAIGPHCMPDLFRTLMYTGKQRSESCNTLITKLVAIDPYNPLVICAQTGLDSSTCRLAYQSLTVTSVTREALFGQSNNPMREMLSRQEKLSEERRREVIMQLDREIGALGKRTDETMIKERSTRVKMLALACTFFKTQLSPPSAITTMPRDPLPGEEMPSPTPSLAFSRVRLITDDCATQLQTAANRFPDLAAVPCHRYGYYSPQCLDAKRKERKDPTLFASPGGQQPVGTPGDMIGRF